MGLFYNLIIPLIGLILMGGSLYYAREQVRIMKAAPSTNQRAKVVAAVSARPWWKSWQLAVMAVLMALTWVPFVYGLIYPPPILAEQYAWGTLPTGDLYLTANFSRSKPDRRIVFVALHYRGLGDLKDQTGIQKSLPYDYEAGLHTFVIDPDQGFRNERAAGQAQVTYMLLEMPPNVSTNQFSTIRQAISLGGNVILTRGAGSAL
jgi:hypothetical protein